MGKPSRVSKKIHKLYRQSKVEISPVLAGLLQESDRIQTIMDQLWEQATAGPLLTEYTNKFGATNLMATAALKELRSWELIFQGVCRSVFKILRADLAGLDDDDDDLQEFDEFKK